MLAVRRSWVSLCVLVASAPAARAQVGVHAGPDQTLPAGRLLTRLDGTVSNPTPLEFWVADGDGATENRLLKWNDVTGLTVVGPLQNAAAQIYGWPSDLEPVRGTVYGIETFFRRLYTLDPATGLCTDVGGTSLPYGRLFGLAYDFPKDKLYAVDQTTRKILLLDRTTGGSSVVMTLAPKYSDLRGLACRQADGRLYFCDDATETLARIDLQSLTVEHVLDFLDGPDAKVDEIEFFEGQLFASYRSFDPGSGKWSMQLARIDLDDGLAFPYGPVIDDCSAHSLVVRSVPENFEWVQAAGPAPATIHQPHQLDTPVSLPRSGSYLFELRARRFHKVLVADQMVVRAPQPPAGGGGSGPGTTK